MYLLRHGFRGFRPKSHGLCRNREERAERNQRRHEPQIRISSMARSAIKRQFGQRFRIVAARVNCREGVPGWLA
jgi:hypothetical protein